MNYKKSGFTLAEGATHTNMPPLKKLPSLARLCRANNPVNCLREVFLFESYARVIEKGLRVGLFPAMGNHITIETIPSLFVRGSQRWRAGETYAGGRGFKKAAFTLAEVLITLAIIGVVAALTLPTLIAKVNEKVDGNQKKVTEAKLIQGLNMLDLHGGINNTYSSTAEFAEELSKYMKITKICDGTNTAFSECIPYSEITYNNGTEDKTVEITKLNTADSLGLGTVTDEEEFMAPVAMVLADGTPMFLTYNKKCISDPDSIKADNKKIHSCVDGLYDLNGSRMPNRVGKDLTAMNKASINIAEGPAVLATIAGYDIIKLADKPPAKDCSAYLGDSKYPEIKSCTFGSDPIDLWVGAVVTCRDLGGHLPTMHELAEIAKFVYPSFSDQISDYSRWVSNAERSDVRNLNVVKDLGFDITSDFSLWSSEEYSNNSGSHARSFQIAGTHGYNNNMYRAWESGYFICLSD